MPRASRRVCTKPGCPVLTTGRRCPTHSAEYERQRGTKQQRGYGSDHDALRKRWAPVVATGTVHCFQRECGQLITRGEPWDLGHTEDRTGWTGPEHVGCNRAAGGRAAHPGVGG